MFNQIIEHESDCKVDHHNCHIEHVPLVLEELYSAHEDLDEHLDREEDDDGSPRGFKVVKHGACSRAMLGFTTPALLVELGRID
eukprot:CAMPEP_0115723920 /NCGR_PEP_ID=MMETSP0272-20121206/80504_1 /TAXON_ID=71861 /ORGANISM="Scrippsiella trochoidea, Strain CCMP3099" /LENGTH=83 /DNA_ID=CAMNT_0003167113 /DNA_START=286 /DNA_END=534 /DNA_ORIENTATION=+